MKVKFEFEDDSAFPISHLNEAIKNFLVVISKMETVQQNKCNSQTEENEQQKNLHIKVE